MLCVDARQTTTSACFGSSSSARSFVGNRVMAAMAAAEYRWRLRGRSSSPFGAFRFRPGRVPRPSPSTADGVVVDTVVGAVSSSVGASCVFGARRARGFGGASSTPSVP